MFFFIWYSKWNTGNNSQTNKKKPRDTIIISDKTDCMIECVNMNNNFFFQPESIPDKKNCEKMQWQETSSTNDANDDSNNNHDDDDNKRKQL